MDGERESEGAHIICPSVSVTCSCVCGDGGNRGLLQEHQESFLGNTMQSVIALLNNLVACKDSNMKLLYEQGKRLLELACDSGACGLFITFFILHSKEGKRHNESQ